MTRDALPRHGDPTELEPRPQPPPAPTGHSTSAQLRRDIESGATGDKTPVLDPAATPLGTDDEAAGMPPAPEAVDAVRHHERTTRPANTQPGTVEPPGAARTRMTIGGLVALGFALGLGALWISFS